MFAGAGLICCSYSPSPGRCHEYPNSWMSTNSLNSVRGIRGPRCSWSLILAKSCKLGASVSTFTRTGKGVLQICRSTLNGQSSEEPVSLEREDGGSGGEGDSLGDKDGRDWSTSILLLVMWAALLYYVFNLAPNQNPSRDMYFLQKLLNLKGDDGFVMNEVLVSLWYILGMWPLIYSMLLLPTARSSKSSVPLWPFLMLSFAAGAYVLIPYFALWRPPAPPLEESELRRWPLNFLESKLTAWISLAAGLGILAYGSANGDALKEFYQYFRESKLVHASSLDFCLFSTFAPFWVFNDMTARKWYEKGWWLLPVSLVPFIGPSLYLVLRPSLSAAPPLADFSV